MQACEQARRGLKEYYSTAFHYLQRMAASGDPAMQAGFRRALEELSVRRRRIIAHRRPLLLRIKGLALKPTERPQSPEPGAMMSLAYEDIIIRRLRDLVCAFRKTLPVRPDTL